MQTIPASLIPPDETERLGSLHKYEVLPSLHEPVFNEFVDLTARLFSLPISLIALVDEDFVYYPANHGMPGHHAQPREEALCSTVILHDSAVVYQNIGAELPVGIAPKAARAAQAHRLQFYAAAPLRTPDRRRVGSLCVIDYSPRVFSLHEQRTLELLADLVSQTVAVRHTCLHQKADGLRRWATAHTQIREEVQALTALVRYLFTRHGTPVPVPVDVLGQVQRRLQDLREILEEHAN